MKALVTGGAGYIGSVVAAQLLDAGHRVVVLDDLSRGHADAVPPGAERVVASLNDAAALAAPLSGGIDARCATRADGPATRRSWSRPTSAPPTSWAGRRSARWRR
jgi:nucleoside-diphosphate-sugar epimerase